MSWADDSKLSFAEIQKCNCVLVFFFVCLSQSRLEQNLEGHDIWLLQLLNIFIVADLSDNVDKKFFALVTNWGKGRKRKKNVDFIKNTFSNTTANKCNVRISAAWFMFGGWLLASALGFFPDIISPLSLMISLIGIFSTFYKWTDVYILTDNLLPAAIIF